ncbi:MAG: phytoene desaturase family protein [Myxococcota bacterium]
MTSVGIVGAGMGGLSAAAILGARGYDVTVFEAGPRAGGKVGIASIDGIEVDTGPTVLTLPRVLELVFEEAGSSLEDELDLIEKDPVFRYQYPRGISLDVCFAPEDTLENIKETFGEHAAEEMDDFLRYAAEIWQAAAPNFVFGEAPSFGSAFKLGLTSLGEMRKIDPLRTMAEGIEKRVATPELRDLLLRYATYNGSNPYSAPATLNCISWVELGMGCYGVEGGMYEIARALERVARSNGVEFRYDTSVLKLHGNQSAITGLETASGAHEIDAVVVNAEVRHLVRELLPHDVEPGLKADNEPSMSGWNAIIKARRRPVDVRAPHHVLFPTNYDNEFADIFRNDAPPRVPTVYLCAQEKAHRRDGWEEHEPLFVMANAPPEPASSKRDPAVWARLRDTVMERLQSAELIDDDDEVVWERTPADLARRFPGSRGSIYGAASNSQLAAFKRPANQVGSIEGLFLAGGTVHPGGGVPLCIQSGRQAATELDEDFGT